MHSSPKAPSVVLRTCELSPAGQLSVEPLRTSALSRTDSPSLHSCSASGSASSFLLASALSLHEPLRTPEAEDARCVQPTSATRTKTITRPPYVLDSLRRLSPSGTPRDSLWLSRCLIEATSIFTMPEALWPHLRKAPERVVLVPSSLRLWVTSAGLFDTAALAGMRPLTPLSRIPLPLHAHVTFVRGLESSRVSL
jgi:hypothetical protein